MYMEHACKGLETVLPGICFTVVFSSNNIFKELPSSNPGVQKNKGCYRAHPCAVNGCTWSPTWALCQSLHGLLPSRGTRTELHHHGTSIATSTWLSPWTAFAPAVHRTLLTHCARIAHTPLLSRGVCWAWEGPLLGCLRDKNQSPYSGQTFFAIPTLIPAARNFPGLSPPQSMDFCQIGQRAIWGIYRSQKRRGEWY